MSTSSRGDLCFEARRHFAEQLRQLLQKRGLTQAELARAAGVSKDAISTYMTHRSLPSEGSLTKIARVLRVDPDLLLPLSSEPASSTPIWLQCSVSAAFAATAARPRRSGRPRQSRMAG